MTNNIYSTKIDFNCKEGGAAAIAPRFRLHLPFCGPGFKSQANRLCFRQFILSQLLLLLQRENDENKQKEDGIGPLKMYRG